jgi:hypothetical protein
VSRTEYSIASLTSSSRPPNAKRGLTGFAGPKNLNFGANPFPYRDATDIRRAQQSSPETSSSEKFSDNGSDDQVSDPV